MGTETVYTEQQTAEFAGDIQQALEFFRTGDEHATLKDGDVQIAVVSDAFPEHGIEARDGVLVRLTGAITVSNGKPVSRFAVSESIDGGEWNERGAAMDIGAALSNAKLAIDRDLKASAGPTPS